MKQQAKLTTFLRTAASPLRNKTAGSSPNRSLAASTKSTEEDIPWPEIDRTGDPIPPSSTSTTATTPTSPYAPLKRKPDRGTSSSGTQKIELQLPSPKRAKKEALPLLESKQPDSLEDIEEFEEVPEKMKEPMPDFTDEELIAISEQLERENSAGTPSQACTTTSTSSSTSSSSSSPSPQHPFFARGGRGKRWGKEFYEHDCETLAKMLLGQVLVRVTSDKQRYSPPSSLCEASSGAHSLTHLSAAVGCGVA
jgi:hypothetical protein